MTPERQRIKIAEWCGWTQNPVTKWWFDPEDERGGDPEPPDYLNDLNAMHEAEKKIDRELYVAQLLAVIHEVDPDYFHKISWENGYELTTATAAQRAEALLRTIGKWTDQQKAPTEAGAETL